MGESVGAAIAGAACAAGGGLAGETEFVTLADGRRLAFRQHGRRDGVPVFVMHGLPGSRLQHNPDLEIAASVGARVISVDRPGIGRSDAHAERRILDWADDLAQLADRLALPRFALGGWSGGGPYAAACAVKLRPRLTRVLVANGMAPLNELPRWSGMRRGNRLLLNLARVAPWLLPPMIAMLGRRARRNPAGHFDAFVRGLPACDRAVIDDPRYRPMFERDLQESLAPGAGGIMTELRLLVRPWGFDVGEIECEVGLMVGAYDTITPEVVGRFWLEHLRRPDPMWLRDDGHFVVVRHWREFLTYLVR
ncbi:MAG: hypothetical protein CHACPFDD_01176 [Phycisphaerae bacterium]|nr:hypothetical protein [Phycisphaerae bacterium]